MRINFVLPHADLSGGSRVSAIHAEGLRRRGHQVVVVSVAQPKPSLRDIARSLLKGKGWPPAPKHGPSHFDPFPLDHRRLNHPGPVTDKDVPDGDVVIGTWWETVQWVNSLSPSKGIKVHFVQGYDRFGGPPEMVDATYAMPLPKIVISEWLRKFIENDFKQTPYAVVHNSVDTKQFHAPPRGKQPVPTVGLVYSDDPNKGYATMAKAFELAKQSLPALRMNAMGTCHVAEHLPLPAGAEFTYQARDEKLCQVYASSDVWLFGSRIEGFGLPILEAMACRTPVIATPAGAAPELVTKGGGILVGADDWKGMGEAIIKVCSLPEAEWKALSDGALATATGYTWDDACDKFEKAIVQLAKR
jgi:glycosyltransferase involved in cell wall biosynthesis